MTAAQALLLGELPEPFDEVEIGTVGRQRYRSSMSRAAAWAATSLQRW